MTREEAKGLSHLLTKDEIIDKIFNYFEADQKKKALTVQVTSEYTNINQDAFNEWMAYKKYKSKGAITKTLNMLNKYDHQTQQDMVDLSIGNEYKGLFPPKQNTQSFKQQDTQRTDTAIDAFLDAREQGFDLRNVSGEVQECEVIER